MLKIVKLYVLKSIYLPQFGGIVHSYHIKKVSIFNSVLEFKLIIFDKILPVFKPYAHNLSFGIRYNTERWKGA